MGGGYHPPWISAFQWEYFENIWYGYVFGNKESNGDNEYILSVLLDLENQGQTPFWMTFVISGGKRGTDLIFVSILTFWGAEMSRKLKSICWRWWLTLKTKVIHMYPNYLFTSCRKRDTNLILVSILAFCRSGISKKTKRHFMILTFDLENQGHTYT